MAKPGIEPTCFDAGGPGGDGGKGRTEKAEPVKELAQKHMVLDEVGFEGKKDRQQDQTLLRASDMKFKVVTYLSSNQ